jgi:hypothetical protein
VANLRSTVATGTGECAICGRAIRPPNAVATYALIKEAPPPRSRRVMMAYYTRQTVCDECARWQRKQIRTNNIRLVLILVAMAVMFVAERLVTGR